MSAKQENHTMDNVTHYATSSSSGYASDSQLSVIYSFTCVVCIFGLLGNGAVIWLLGFRMKRNPFTTYVLNLAVADFGVLIASISMVLLLVAKMKFPVDLPCSVYAVSGSIFHFAYSMSQFLLTAISIDRCVAVLFPLWYRCRRPERLSTVLCALIWLLSFLVHGICCCFRIILLSNPVPLLFYSYLVNAVVCLPLITVSTLTLFVRVCLKSQQRQRGKLLTAILLALFFFLVFAFPMNVILLIWFNSKSSLKVLLNLECYKVTEYGFLCACLSSFVNPLLYFLVGRKRRGLCRENLKLILQRIFMEAEEEEEACTNETETQ